MKTIAILGRKGGTGKTTLAIHLAVAAAQDGYTTALIDLDPQASAVDWSDQRHAETPVVVSAHSARLGDLLSGAAERGVDFAFIDTAAHAEVSALAAARAATFALIPCRPASLDLRAIGATIDVTRLAKIPVHVVLNGTPARGNLTDQARRAIDSYNVPCAPCAIGQRIAFVHALTDGLSVIESEPYSKASYEIRMLYTYLMDQIDKEG